MAPKESWSANIKFSRNDEKEHEKKLAEFFLDGWSIDPNGDFKMKGKELLRYMCKFFVDNEDLVRRTVLGATVQTKAPETPAPEAPIVEDVEPKSKGFNF